MSGKKKVCPKCGEDKLVRLYRARPRTEGKGAGGYVSARMLFCEKCKSFFVENYTELEGGKVR